MSPEVLIELQKIDVMREDGPATIVRDVSWTISRGEFWVICGPPSGGKSSLLATAVGLSRPSGESLRIFGRNLAEATEAEQVDWRRRIGFVFENGGRLLSHLTVAQNVALPLEYHSAMSEAELDAKVEEVLRRAELVAQAHTMPSRLNLRVQQRAGLMRALIVPTEVLVLDNPLNGLSPRDARWWLDYLRELQVQQAGNGKPLTFIVTSDDFRDWLDLADRFALIRNNELHMLGNREQLLANKDAGVLEFL